MRTRLGITALVVLALVVAACGDDDTGVTGAGGVSCAVEDLDLHEAGVLTIATGEPVFARYNPPFMPWFFRRNEVLIAVDKPTK